MAWWMARSIRVLAGRSATTERSSIFAWQPSSEGACKRRGWSLLIGAIALALLISTADAQTAPAGLRNDVVFTEYTPFSSQAELVRRLYGSSLQHAGQTLGGQVLDLAQERYSLYIP